MAQRRCELTVDAVAFNLSNIQQPASCLDVLPVDIGWVLLIQRDQAPQVDDMASPAPWPDLPLTGATDDLPGVSVDHRIHPAQASLLLWSAVADWWGLWLMKRQAEIAGVELWVHHIEDAANPLALAHQLATSFKRFSDSC